MNYVAVNSPPILPLLGERRKITPTAPSLKAKGSGRLDYSAMRTEAE
jgi:hypothetical protein